MICFFFQIQKNYGPITPIENDISSESTIMSHKSVRQNCGREREKKLKLGCKIEGNHAIFEYYSKFNWINNMQNDC